ncbi:ABC transporter permease subunit [Halobaculum sp. MBLA0147]|uniref:ABC transporter permease subunit n=1 Tax=Halobaculum sp. MBLA0147 TaxID=3079934 RepID=UPI00352471E2
MRRLSLLARIGRTLSVVPLVYTLAFLAQSFVPNRNLGSFGYAPTFEGVRTSPDPMFARRDVSLLDSYVEWAVRLLTGEWGTVGGPDTRAATALVGDALGFTAVYFLPALLVALLFGTGVQLYAAASDRTLDAWTRPLAVLVVSVPAFLFAYLANTFVPVFLAETTQLTVIGTGYRPSLSPLAPRNLLPAATPFAATLVVLFGIQSRYAGTELAEYADRPFVKIARAKGAGPLRVAVHLLPHAAARLATLLLSEAFGAVLVAGYVIEWATSTPGIFALTIEAVASRRPGLVFPVVLLPVVVVVTVNLLQELYYLLFDPRVDAGDGETSG